MAALPKFQLYPESISLDKNECLLLISQPVQEGDISVSLQIMGEQADEAELEVKDSRTFLISIPQNYLNHEKIMAYIKYRGTMIGCERLRVEQPCEQLARLLEKVLDPIQLMMSSLGLKSGTEVDFDTLDRDLSNVVAKNIPADQLGVLFKDYDKATPTSGDMPAKDRFPTALHFSANYGFTKLTETLLYCHGSKAALMVTNSEGNTPREIATNKGYHQILRAFEKKATEHDEYYESLSDVLGEEPRLAEAQGIYMDMGPMRSDDNPRPVIGKVTMAPPLPCHPPPQRPRTNSTGPLHSIKEDEQTAELRDSGVFEGCRDSNMSNDSRVSSNGLDSVRLIDSPSSKGCNLKRSKPVTIRRGDVVSDSQDGEPFSIGHRPLKRPSLPNLHDTTAPFSPDEGPPPCTGPMYQNQKPNVPPLPSARKMSLPVPGVMNELQKSQIFQKRKQSTPA